METNKYTKRTLNIISKAFDNGFKIDETETIEDVKIDAEDFLIDNTEHKLEECDVDGSASKQSVHWTDDEGYEFECYGGIVDFSAKHKDGERVLHEVVIDSEANVIQLYYLTD